MAAKQKRETKTADRTCCAMSPFLSLLWLGKFVWSGFGVPVYCKWFGEWLEPRSNEIHNYVSHKNTVLVVVVIVVVVVVVFVLHSSFSYFGCFNPTESLSELLPWRPPDAHGARMLRGAPRVCDGSQLMPNTWPRRSMNVWRMLGAYGFYPLANVNKKLWKKHHV